jgi:hypothetical protein
MRRVGVVQQSLVLARFPSTCVLVRVVARPVDRSVAAAHGGQILCRHCTLRDNEARLTAVYWMWRANRRRRHHQSHLPCARLGPVRTTVVFADPGHRCPVAAAGGKCKLSDGLGVLCRANSVGCS